MSSKFIPSNHKHLFNPSPEPKFGGNKANAKKAYAKGNKAPANFKPQQKKG